MTGFEREPGSFRDRSSGVYYREGAVFRGLTRHALHHWDALCSTKFFPRLIAEGKLVHTERVDTGLAGGAIPPGQWAAVLKHRRIPFVSYPYEWPFGMLKGAAVLQLELLLTAIDEGMILKDATPFNVQWVGTQPVFIDIPSFEKLTSGQPWTAYRQFCEMFLYPLFLQAYRHVPFHPWLRGHIEGVSAQHCRNLMSARDLVRPGVFTHVLLHAALEARHGRTSRDIKTELQAAGFNEALIRTNVRRLLKVLRRLRWRAATSPWSGYADRNTYGEPDAARKLAFVRDVVGSRRWNLVWDVGCNTGTFARIAAEHARYVVAMDADHVVIERLYQALAKEENTRILPLVLNVADPPPNLGWRGLERRGLAERGTPDLTLCLALVHHLVIGANIPMIELLDWLGGLGTDLVIEFVGREDPMVQRLLRSRRDNYPDYEVGHFERSFGNLFRPVKREVLGSGTRVLYYGQNRRGGSGFSADHP